MSLSLANHDTSLPVAYRLYLPEDWAKDPARREKPKVPETIDFQTKPEIALEQIQLDASEAIFGATNGHIYAGSAPASRPAEDYTVRIIPCHPGVRIPAELPQILWQEQVRREPVECKAHGHSVDRGIADQVWKPTIRW